MQKLCVGDAVVVVRGNDKGKQGKVRRILRERKAVIVEGVHRVKRHLRPQPNRAGGILEVEAPIAASNVMLVDPKTGKATRVKIGQENGVRVRIAKSGAPIPVQER